MAGIGNGKRKPDGNAEISLRTGRMTNCKTKPPARRIIITTTTATTIRTKIKKPNSSNNRSASQNPERKKTDLGEKLGQDGKLTPAERSCRFANNLCVFCSGVGHTAKDCSKAAKAKGRAAQVTSSDGKPAEDAKKIDSSLLEPARTSGCDDIDRAIDEVRLNAAAPF